MIKKIVKILFVVVSNRLSRDVQMMIDDKISSRVMISIHGKILFLGEIAISTYGFLKK